MLGVELHKFRGSVYRMETLEESRRRIKDDVPPLGRIIFCEVAPEWVKKYGYPAYKIKAADYYVKYEYGRDTGFGPHVLIEATETRIHKKKKKLEVKKMD